MSRPQRVELTRARINAIDLPPRGDRIVYDTKLPKLGVRATAKGHKSYVLYRRVHGKPRRLLVVPVSDDYTVEEVRAVARWMGEGIDSGREPAAARRAALLAHDLHRRPEHAMPEEQARRLARLIVEAEGEGLSEPEARAHAGRIIRMMAEDGLTVAEARQRIAEQQRERERLASRETLDEVFARYMEQHAKPKKRSWRDDQRLYDYNVRDVLGQTAFDDLDVATIRALHAKVGQRAPIQANRTLAVLSRVFTFHCGKNAANPCRGIERFSEVARNRRLTSHELPRFIAAIDQFEQETGNDTGADILRTLLLTGQRLSNVLAMRWAELDLDAGTWTIPASHFKNKQPHTAALPQALVTILLRRKLRYGRHKYVFPGNGGRAHRTDSYKAWQRVLTIAGIDAKNIRLHDLRATFATLMAENGETLEAIARQMGHRSYATTKRYMRLSQASVKSAVERTASVMQATDNGQSKQATRSAG